MLNVAKESNSEKGRRVLKKKLKVFKRTEIANVDNRDESKQDKRARSFVQ
jgi:hypothetical protein